VQPQSGLTPEEQEVSDLLVQAWNRFMAFEDAIKSDDQEEFRQAIHAAQRVLQTRMLRRLFPEYWS